jgi:hypothetical protein
MNVFVLMLGASIFLIPNVLFAMWLTWTDLTDNATLSVSGHRYVRGVFAFIAVSLIITLMGIVGTIQTM